MNPKEYVLNSINNETSHQVGHRYWYIPVLTYAFCLILQLSQDVREPFYRLKRKYCFKSTTRKMRANEVYLYLYWKVTVNPYRYKHSV
jgi:hypothetical protein